VSLEAWHQLVESASRDAVSIVENGSLTVDLGNAESIFDFLADAAAFIEQRGQQFQEPFVRSLNLNCKLSELRSKRVAFVKSPASLQKSQPSPVAQGLVNMLSRIDAVQPLLCEFCADCIHGIVVQQAAPNVRGCLIEFVNLLSGFAEEDRPIVQ
jgi:hypothetical protein